jgi:hypothetical protein
MDINNYIKEITDCTTATKIKFSFNIDVNDIVNEFYIQNFENFDIKTMPSKVYGICFAQQLNGKRTTDFDDYKTGKNISYDKVCSKCKEVLHISMYRLMHPKNAPEVYRADCKDCEAAVANKYRKLNIDKIVTIKNKHKLKPLRDIQALVASPSKKINGIAFMNYNDFNAVIKKANKLI